MAISRHLAEMLLREHLHKPISGSILLLSRQTVFLTPQEAVDLVNRCGIDVLPSAKIEKDTYTYRGIKEGYISDESFFSLFTEARIEVTDFAPKRGVTIVHDLCAPVPEELHRRFDFIYNGSVLDNVFDCATAMDNITRMLKPGGVAFHYEGPLSSHIGGVYTQFSPAWFFDYGAINRFEDCQVFYALYPDFHLGKWDVLLYHPYHSTDGVHASLVAPLQHDGDALLICIMQAGLETTSGKRPIQAGYRTDHAPYSERFQHFATKGRRYQMAPVKNQPGYWHIGTFG
jgi:hypothetical protein